MIGPPATPRRIGVSIPGMFMGIVPNAKPRTNPRKMLPIFGSLRVLTEFPKNCSTLFTASCLPTTVTRSPYCKRKSSVARSFMSPRVMRLTLTLYVFRNCSCPKTFPLSAVRVTTRVRLSTSASIAFQSILSLFQSVSTFFPNKSSIARSSSRVVTTITLSFTFKTVSAFGTITSLSRQRREIMNLRWVICTTLSIVFPSMAGFMISNSAMYVLLSSVSGFDSRSAGRTKNLRKNIMAKITPTTPSG